MNVALRVDGGVPGTTEDHGDLSLIFRSVSPLRPDPQSGQEYVSTGVEGCGVAQDNIEDIKYDDVSGEKYHSAQVITE